MTATLFVIPGIRDKCRPLVVYIFIVSDPVTCLGVWKCEVNDNSFGSQNSKFWSEVNLYVANRSEVMYVVEYLQLPLRNGFLYRKSPPPPQGRINRGGPDLRPPMGVIGGGGRPLSKHLAFIQALQKLLFCVVPVSTV